MLRLIGRLLSLAALLVFARDVVSWWNGGPMRLSDLGEWWFWAHPDSLQLLQPAIERHITPVLWDPVMLTLLTWPLAPQLLVLAIVFEALHRAFRRA